MDEEYNLDNYTIPDEWEFSLEAILAEYASEPEPTPPRTPEESRSREIVMEALSERIAENAARAAEAAIPEPDAAGNAVREPETTAPAGGDYPEETAAPPRPRHIFRWVRDPLDGKGIRPLHEEDPEPAQEPEPEPASEPVSETMPDEADGLTEPDAAEPEKPEEFAAVDFPTVDMDEIDAQAEAEAEAEAADSTASLEAAAAAAADPWSGETATREERRAARKRPNIFVTLLAAVLIRRRQRAEKARLAEKAEREAAENAPPEATLKAAAKYYIRSIAPFKLRFSIAAVLCFILLYISWGLPVAGALKTIRVSAGMCMVLELSVMLLGLDVLTAGLRALFRGRPGLESLAAVSCIVSVLDALVIMCGGPQHGLPFCAVSAVTLTIALLAQRLLCLGLARSFRTGGLAASPSVVSSESGAVKEGRVLLRGERSVAGFVNRSQYADLVEEAYRAAAPVLLVGALVLAFIATVCRRQAGDFLHALSALTAVSTSFSALLCFTLPFAVVSRRLSSSGAAVAGWAGTADVGESRRTVVTDEDIFPAGNVLIDTVRILQGVRTDKVISYAGSVIACSGSDLVAPFTELMRSQGCAMHQVENFAVHKGGGLTAIVRGEQVFVGNSSFMNLMGIRLDEKQLGRSSVFAAISGELVGVFSIRYTPTASVQEALVNLLHSRAGAPLFAVRDFNVTPYLIKQRFRMPTEGFDFPSHQERYRLSALEAAPDSPPALLLARRGLGPYVEATQTVRSLWRGSRLCLVLSLLCSVLGMLLLFFLAFGAAWDSATVGNVLLYLFLWLVPVVVVALGLRR